VNGSNQAESFAEDFKREKICVELLSFEWMESIVGSMAVVCILMSMIFIKMDVSGKSMLPTLHDKDKIILTEYSLSSPKNGDIIVVSEQGTRCTGNIVKRVIATAGQKIKIDFENSDVYVDGNLLKENYIVNPKENLTYGGQMINKDQVLKNNEEVTVPEDCLFVMGDNRNHSDDSRSKRVGFVNKKYVIGKAQFVFWPFNDWKFL